MKRLRNDHERDLRITTRGKWVFGTIWVLLFIAVCYIESKGMKP